MNRIPAAPRLLSVITAVHGPHVRYLAEAYESLVAQALPDGWAWEWLVQADGSASIVADAAVPSDDARIRVSGGTPGGAAVARNLALATAQGELVKVLDADDQLTAGALARDIAVLERDRTIGWTTASALDLADDGSLTEWTHTEPPGGELSQDFVLEYFTRNDYRLPVHPASLCIRRKLALALGGWTALPGGEDTGLLVAASVVSRGYFIDTPGLLYRKHAGQMTARPNWSSTEEWATRMRFVEARATVLREFGSRAHDFQLVPTRATVGRRTSPVAARHGGVTVCGRGRRR